MAWMEICAATLPATSIPLREQDHTLPIEIVTVMAQMVLNHYEEVPSWKTSRRSEVIISPEKLTFTSVNRACGKSLSTKRGAVGSTNFRSRRFSSAGRRTRSKWSTAISGSRGHPPIAKVSSGWSPRSGSAKSAWSWGSKCHGWPATRPIGTASLRSALWPRLWSLTRTASMIRNSSMIDFCWVWKGPSRRLSYTWSARAYRAALTTRRVVGSCEHLCQSVLSTTTLEA